MKPPTSQPEIPDGSGISKDWK